MNPLGEKKKDELKVLSKRKCMPVCAQSCPTLCDPKDCSLLGSSVHVNFPGRNISVS